MVAGQGDKRRLAIPRSTILWLAVSAVLGAGCATLQRYEVRQTEEILGAAGFDKDTLERRQELRSTPPHRIVSGTKDGKVIYTYSDPDGCRCVYVGGDEQYAEYERLKRQLRPRASGSSPSGGAPGGAP